MALVSKILEETLTAGSTAVTFTDSDIPNSLIRVFSSDSSIIPESRILSGNTLTVTYAPQTSNIGVALEIVKQGLDIVDNVLSTDTDKALSAKQGYLLNAAIGDVSDGLDTLTNTVNNLDIPDNITDLEDVAVTSIQDGQVLAWDSVSQKFENVTPASGGGVNYSETEQDSGIKWIDGKTLYQKTINFGALPNNTTKQVNHNISNIDNICKIECIMNYPGLVFGEILPPLEANKGFRLNVRQNTVEVSTTGNWSSYTAYVTVYYTKTA